MNEKTSGQFLIKETFFASFVSKSIMLAEKAISSEPNFELHACALIERVIASRVISSICVLSIRRSPTRLESRTMQLLLAACR